MPKSVIRTRREKILFPIAMIFSGIVWIALLAGIFAPIFFAASGGRSLTTEPCVYRYNDQFYSTTQLNTLESPEMIECLEKYEVPSNVWTAEKQKLKKEISQAPLKDMIAGSALSSTLLFYLILILAFIYTTNALMMAYIRLNAVKISKTQYPAFYKIYEETAMKLGLKKIPDAYIIQAGGELNAFAIKITRKKMVVFFADLIEQLIEGEKYDELHAVTAHELTHVYLKHVHYWIYLMPFLVLPILGPLFSRARETSADRGAMLLVNNHHTVSQALVKLATGKFVAKHINLDEYVQQPKTEKGLFIFLAKIMASHPPIPSRIASLRKMAEKQRMVQKE